MTKTQQLRNFSYFGSSHIGTVREENEDTYAYFDTVNGSFFVLCDGMGGVKGGKEAAETTTKQIEKYVTKSWENSPKKLIRNAIEFANTEVFSAFMKKKKTEPPGSTIVLVLIRDNKVYYAHVGDSRVYYQTGKKLFPLTKDHSYVMNLVEKKVITEEEAREHERRNEITKAIGIREIVNPTICKDPIIPADDDFILLCSDGLTNELSNKEILNILQNNKKTKEKVKDLINTANKKGGGDNVTVQLIRFYNTGKDANTEYIKRHTIGRKKTKKTAIFITGFIFIAALIFAIRSITHCKVKKAALLNVSNTSLLRIKKQNDTLINVFTDTKENKENILRRFNVQPSDIGYSSGAKNKNYTKYYIPVEAVYYKRIGAYIYAYPEVQKNNMIDILIANEKKELFFRPGEKIIIPKKNNIDGRRAHK